MNKLILVLILIQVVMLEMGLEYCVLGDLHDMLYITTLTLLLASLIMILFMDIDFNINWFLINQIFIIIVLNVIYIAPYYLVLNLFPFTVMLVLILIYCALNVAGLYKVMGER